MFDPVPPASGGQSTAEAYLRGRQNGLAWGALAVSLLAFISLLGLEKALLAIVLAVLAMRTAPAGARGHRLAVAAVSVAALYAVTWLVVLVVFRDKLFELVQLLQKLG